jgi:ABC-2 type transport system ATP-binding protein
MDGDPGMTAPAVHATGLVKRYGDFTAVAGLDLEIGRGEFFGLLGPNGAGKSTSIHMLSSLVQPSEGTASVCGIDTQVDPVAVRQRIGLVFQDSALDRQLSVWENLRFSGLLYDLPLDDTRERAEHLIKLFGLEEKRDKPVGSLSGGQRRALDIARGVLHRPEVLFLDEPTIGLDLPSRRRIWRFIAQLRAETGMTVLLTTHYLEEAADCDRVAFIRGGKIVLSGEPAALVGDLGAEIIEVSADQPEAVRAELEAVLGPARVEFETLSFRPPQHDPARLNALVESLGNRVRSVVVRRPNLNDVFLWVNQ